MLREKIGTPPPPGGGKKRSVIRIVLNGKNFDQNMQKKITPRPGGGPFLGGPTGGGGFRVLACADTGARTTLGVHQYFLLVLYLYCTYTFNTIIVRTSSYYYQISFKRLNMYLIGLTFISSVLI
jgi:hypothetical protein